MDDCCTLLTIKLLPPLSKGKLLLIRKCLFKNHHKCYPSIFDRRTPRIKFLIQPLGVHPCFPSEKVSCDGFCLWQSLPLHPLQHGSKIWPQLLVPLHRHDCWLLLSLSYRFDKGHTEILSQRFLKILIVDVNGQNIITWICIIRNILSLRFIYFWLPSVVQCPMRKLVDDGTELENIFKDIIKGMEGTDHDYF